MLCRESRVSSCTNSGEGGGFSTITCAVAGVFSPRESLQLALIVIDPAEVPTVFKTALPPLLPEMLPLLAVHPPTVTVALSGLLQVQLTFEEAPISTFD